MRNFKVLNSNDFFLDLEQYPWISVEEFEDADQVNQAGKNVPLRSVTNIVLLSPGV